MVVQLQRLGWYKQLAMSQEGEVRGDGFLGPSLDNSSDVRRYIYFNIGIEILGRLWVDVGVVLRTHFGAGAVC
jgi:hypothetical protein